MKILITGGAGFIGSSFVRFALRRWPDAALTVLDALTYAGNIANLGDLLEDSRIRFVRGDISDPVTVDEVMPGHTHVVNLAAETHVDRSILDSRSVIRTNVEGTRVLLEAAVRGGVQRFAQVSTDEVYGEVPAPVRSREEDPLHPRSPYAASKAAADLLVGAYAVTHRLNAVITRGANTYGPRQYPEKLLPLFITNALDGLALPLYGDGLQMRDWLSVEDHCRGIAAVLERGRPGEIYNLGAGGEQTNLEIAHRVLVLTGADPALLRHVSDRPGHDRRYALDSSRAHALGWRPHTPLEQGLARTVDWYGDNRDWWEAIKSGEFQNYYERQYGERLRTASPAEGR